MSQYPIFKILVQALSGNVESDGHKALPLIFWLNWPDGNMADCYQLGAVRAYLLEKLFPNDRRMVVFWDTIVRDFDSEDAEFPVECLMTRHWIQSYLSFTKWYAEALFNYSWNLEFLLDHPERVSATGRSEQLQKYYKYGALFQLHDFARRLTRPKALACLWLW